MSLASQITLLATRVGQEIKAVRALIVDATTTTKGQVQLAGDLAGTAAAPTVPGLSGKANTTHTHVATTDLTATGTKDATTFLRGDNTWAAPAGASTSGANYTVTTEYNTNKPASPTTGLTVYTKFKARRDLAQVDPLGFDLTMQSAVFANNATYWQAANNGGNLTTVGGSSPAVIGTSSAIQNASTNFYTSCVRMGNKNTAATAGLGAGFRTAAPQWFLSNTANMGGFFFVCRFGLATTTATNRVFVGLSTTNAALSPTVNPSTFTQMIGFGADSTDTSLQFMSNAALATATKVSLGTNFPSQTAATNFYEVRLFAPSGSASTVYWSAERLNDNVFTSGTATTNLPAANGIMAGHVHYSNGTTATIGQIDLQMLYIESDN